MAVLIRRLVLTDLHARLHVFFAVHARLWCVADEVVVHGRLTLVARDDARTPLFWRRLDGLARLQHGVGARIEDGSAHTNHNSIDHRFACNLIDLAPPHALISQIFVLRVCHDAPCLVPAASLAACSP